MLNLVTKLLRVKIYWGKLVSLGVCAHFIVNNCALFMRAFTFDTEQHTHANMLSTSTLISLNKHWIIVVDDIFAFYSIEILLFFSSHSPDSFIIISVVADGFRSHCNNFIWCTLLLNVKIHGYPYYIQINIKISAGIDD